MLTSHFSQKSPVLRLTIFLYQGYFYYCRCCFAKRHFSLFFFLVDQEARKAQVWRTTDPVRSWTPVSQVGVPVHQSGWEQVQGTSTDLFRMDSIHLLVRPCCLSVAWSYVLGFLELLKLPPGNAGLFVWVVFLAFTWHETWGKLLSPKTQSNKKENICSRQ